MPRVSISTWWVTCALLVGLVYPSPARGQADGGGTLEDSLPHLSGTPRVHALAELTRANRSVAPEKALAFGREALALIEDLPDAQAEVTTLNAMGWALMELGRYEDAIGTLERSRSRAEGEGDRPGLARALNNLGVIQRRTGGYALALEYFRESMDIYRALGDEEAQATSLNNLSVVLGWDLGTYDRALDYQLQALEIREARGDREGIFQSHNTLGVLYANLGDYPEALHHLGVALDGWEQLGLAPRIAATLHNMAGVYIDTGDLGSALEAQERSLAIRKELKSTSGVANSEASIGTVLTRMGRLGEARVHLDESLRVRRELGERKNTALSLMAMTELDRIEGRLESGEARAVEALAIAQETGSQDVEKDAHAMIATLREARGDFRGALESHRRAVEIESRIFSEARSRRIEALQVEYEADRSRQEIERLAAEAALVRSDAERRRTQFLVVLLVVAVAILLYRRRVARHIAEELEQQVRERTQELSVANARLSDLSHTDPLTGLRNRRHLLSVVDTEVSSALREGRDFLDGRTSEGDGKALTFYLIDVDHFKRVNDQYGHATGDRVLEQMGAVLRDTVRGADTLVRWGGEEFLVVSSGRDRGAAGHFAERIRRAVHDSVFRVGEGVALRLTCSIGFASFPFIPEEPGAVAWEQVVTLADHATYVAKRSGRDAWVGVRATSRTEEGSTQGILDDFRFAVQDGQLELVTSLSSEGREVRWGDPAGGSFAAGG
ncbi:MAG: tetratricopeptide repeat protein [Gemmatimonadota bacterium]|nr:tetratricopeptide repeat protein [Gemmatimonadota bacterium]MDH5760263.1 tetratricopeptide repeat protein [Gemmatimonadota bacterium]